MTGLRAVFGPTGTPALNHRSSFHSNVCIVARIRVYVTNRAYIMFSLYIHCYVYAVHILLKRRINPSRHKPNIKPQERYKFSSNYPDSKHFHTLHIQKTITEQIISIIFQKMKKKTLSYSQN